MISNRKAALERELADIEADRAAMLARIEDEAGARRARAARELEKLNSLPDLDALVDGTVDALGVTYGRSRPYVVIGYKTRDLWYLTGDKSPNGVSSDALASWLTTSGRNLVMFEVLAEIETVTVGVVDLSALLGMGGR